MKNNSTFHPLLVIGLLLVLMFSCKKTNSPKLASTVTVVAVSSITATTATSGGDISSDGGAAITARGVCWSVNQNPTTADSRTTDGTGTGSFTSSITGLTPGITYNIRAYATNSVGTGYSSQSTFTTLALAPVLTTTEVSAITSTTATSGGNITNDGGSAITARGVCWSTSTSPTTAGSKTTDATGSGSFTSAITGLIPGVTYYIRAYATNSIGAAYGNQVVFTTDPITVTDLDGNVYNVIRIGTQVWMAENLKTTKYRNGDPIPNVTDNTAWAALSTGAYCWLNNDAVTYKATYGALYNWWAVSDSRNIAPTGWHVPTDAEWTTLTTFLGGESVAGGKLKETGTTHWQSPNTDATNSSGFTALPGGDRNSGGTFYTIGYHGFWWSSTANGASYAWYAWYQVLGYDFASVNRNNFYKQGGDAVRCVRD